MQLKSRLAEPFRRKINDRLIDLSKSLYHIKQLERFEILINALLMNEKGKYALININSDGFLLNNLQKTLTKPIELSNQLFIFSLKVIQLSDFLLLGLTRHKGANIIFLAGCAFQDFSLSVC